MLQSSSLSQFATTLSHIHEQFQSSYDSVLFIHGLLSAFHRDLTETTCARQAELLTMSTEPGIQLRKIILTLQSNLAKEILHGMELYGSIGAELTSRVYQLKQAVKQAIHQTKNLQQNQKFIKIKSTLIDEEVYRLAKISQTIERNLYIKNLKQKFSFQNKNQIGGYIFKDQSQESINSINNKLEGYINEHKNIMNFVQVNMAKNQSVINELIAKLKILQENSHNFSKIYQLINNNKHTNPYAIMNRGDQNARGSAQRPKQLYPIFTNTNRNSLNCRQVHSADSNRLSEVSPQMSTAMKNYNMIAQDFFQHF